ncbi:MAG: hypothetical protein NTV86_16395, partial [Planctomycetota bacterium]|nr:hypothetical protein [Planctomycetota bacterium]
MRSVVALGLDDLAAAGAKPMTVAIHADVTAGADSVTGTAGLQGDAGDLKLGFSYAKGDKPVAFRIDELIDALAHGNAVPLPDVTADLAGAVDFARLAGSLPALVNVRSDARLKRCRVEFQALHVQGGLRPAVKGRIVLPALEADVAGSPVHWDEAALDLAVWTDPLNRVHIDKSQFDLGAGLLHCQVSGEA